MRPDEEYFVFRTGELTLAVESGHVREVTRMGPLTPLPRTPSFVLGVVGQRGQVLPVVDLLRFLGQGEARAAKRSRMFIGEAASFTVGFLADSVVGLRRIFVSEKLPAPLGAGTMHEYLDGVVHSREFGMLSLLNLPRVVHAARLKVVLR